MTKDEALKMAIEAMEDVLIVIEPNQLDLKKFNNAIKACKQALAQPQPRMFLDLSNSNGNNPVEQQAQEPVAMIRHKNGNFSPAPSCQECENLKHDLEGYMDANKELINREWQGLSDDETENILDKLHYDVYPVRNLANAIEQALKEKNT